MTVCGTSSSALRSGGCLSLDFLLAASVDFFAYCHMMTAVVIVVFCELFAAQFARAAEIEGTLNPADLGTCQTCALCTGT